MGPEYLGTVVEEEVTPSVPPGFVPHASIILKKMNDGDGTMSSMASGGVSKLQPTEMDAKCEVSDDGKLTRCLRRRPGINYSQFDNSSDEESDSEKFDQKLPSSPRLPKGVLRGCLECPNCQKVIARWRPRDACRPILEDAPVFYPTEEEFKDTLKYIASIRPRAERYGICRIVPPSSWTPPCPLTENDMWKNSKFATRIQRVDKLQNRNSTRKEAKVCSKTKRKKRRRLDIGVESRINGNVVSPNELGCYNEADRFGFEPGPELTLEGFKKYADDFKAQYFRKEESGTEPVGSQSMLEKHREPSVENIEGEYWRMVEKPTEEIEVLYGADLETGKFGSGFPKVSSLKQGSSYDEKYLKSGWNLNNFPRLPGSVLSFESGDISGVLVPWLYIGMCFSSFCWHVEDHHLYSLNYMHWGAPKMWYGVPGESAPKLEAAMKKHLPNLFQEQPDLLHKLVTQLSPSILMSEGVPVYRCVQNPREFILTFPRAYHSGFNCGFNCAEAVNVAPLDWLPHGQNAIEMYCEQRRKTTVSHDKLLLGASREAVKAHFELLLLSKSTSDNIRWKDVCGKGGLLAKALKARVEMERLRREYVCAFSRSTKMDVNFDSICERECVICFYDLHLSAVGCQCSSERFSCLNHAKQLCSCDWNTKTFLFRYDISELNILVEALEGKLSAIYRWANLHLGLALSSHNTLHVPDPIGKQSHTSDIVVQKENASQPALTSTCTNGVTSKSFQEVKKPVIQVTSLNDLIQKPFHYSGAKQKEPGLPDTAASTGIASRPPGFHQKFKETSVQLQSLEHEAEHKTPIVSNSTHSLGGDISSLPKVNPREVVLSLGVPDKKYREKKIVNKSLQVTAQGGPVLHSNLLTTPVCELSQEDTSYSEVPQDTSSKMNSVGCTTSIKKDNSFRSSVADEYKTKKSSSPGDDDVVLLSDDEGENLHKLDSKGENGVSCVNYSEVSARLANDDDMVSPCNHQKDQVLYTPETNASVMSEGDVKLISKAEKADDLLHPQHVKSEDLKIGNRYLEQNSMVTRDTTSVAAAPQNLSRNVGSANTSFVKTTQNLLPKREPSECDMATSGSHLQAPQLNDGTKSNTYGNDENKGLMSSSSLLDNASPMGESPSLIPNTNNLDRYYRQKGPRIAKVVRRINCSVEPLEIGAVLSGKLWSSSQTIYPKGFKSRVNYLGVLDPTKMCSYISQVLDAGLLGPLFMVTLEESPTEIFIHASPSKCWEMVRDKINQEIRKQHASGRTNLPPLQPPGSLDGLEMFGFTSPTIIQAIEALDKNKVCIEYWKSRAQAQKLHHSMPGKFAGKEEAKDEKPSPNPRVGVDVLVKSLFRKASSEQLHSLYSILSATDQELASRLLRDEIDNRVQDNYYPSHTSKICR